MKILILVGNYPPTISSCARLYSELAESLNGLRHNVTVITEHPLDGNAVDKNHKYYTNRSSRININGVEVIRISELSFLSKFSFTKALRFFFSFILYTFRGIFTSRKDVVLVYSPPLYMGIAGFFISKVKKIPMVFNMQDIHPKVLFDSGAIKNKFLKLLFLKMEELCYRKASSFIVYSKGNKDYLIGKDVALSKIFIIPNWVDISEKAVQGKTNSFRNDKLIADKFLVTYAGTIQEAQGLEIVVEAAGILKEYNNILIIIAGDGSSKTYLQNLIHEKKLNNIKMYPMMSKNLYIEFIYASDVCLVPLSPDTPLQTVPGKLADIMARGKPIIAVVNYQGDTASIIRSACCGICVAPGDARALSHAVLKLHNDRELKERMGAAARFYSEKYFSRDICIKQYEEALLSVIKEI